MATFVLVHGTAQGAWCWQKVIPLLKDGGNTVIAPDLPGHGDDHTPLAVVTMDRYVDAVCRAMATQPGKMILAGHGMGGAVVSLVAESMPQSVDRLIYLAAYVPASGQTLGDLMQADGDSLLPEAFDAAEDNSCITPKADKVAEALFNGCSAEDAQAAVAKLTPQAVNPMFQPVEITTERFGSVARFGIVCTDDHAISPGMQEQMYTAAGCKAVVKLAAGHAAFLSKPAELAKSILELAGK